MRQNNIKRAFCWLLAMVLAMLPTLAQGSRQVITTSEGKQYCLTSSQPGIQWEQKGDIWHPVHKAQPKAEPTEGSVTVTIDASVGDMVDVYLDYFQLLDSQGVSNIVYGNSKAVTPGTYDLLATFAGYDSENRVPLFYFVLKENVVITVDTTITMDATEAQKNIEVRDHHPGGELFKCQENCGIAVIESGLCRKNDEGSLLMISSNTFTRNLPKTYINEVSNRFTYYQANSYTSVDWQSDSRAYATFYVTDDLTQPLENNAADYHLITEHFTPSKVSRDEAEAKAIGSKIVIFYGEKKITDFSTGNWINDLSICDVNLYVNMQNQGIDFDGVYALACPVMTDYLEVVDYFPWGEAMYQPRRIDVPSLAINQDEVIYLNLGFTGLESYFLNDGNKISYPFARGSHPFYYTQAQKLQDFGSGVPIYVYQNFRNMAGGVMIGRYGENRQVDVGQTSLCLKKNGEQVWQGGMLDYEQNDFYEQKPLGVIEGVYTNDNVIVDDLQGLNVTTVHYDEQYMGDIPPTLTMLWFKDTEGNATDRFSNAAHGILEFSAGDFTPYFRENYFNGYACEALGDVEVTYSPYQQDAWSELAVEEVPENFCWPGYGYFYRGSLAGVTGEAMKGWFDLKVRLTDGVGNWQEQVISPAFRINDLAYSSVAIVGSGNAHEVARYNLAGQRIDAATPGIAIVKMSDGTARKMHVK